MGTVGIILQVGVIEYLEYNIRLWNTYSTILTVAVLVGTVGIILQVGVIGYLVYNLRNMYSTAVLVGTVGIILQVLYRGH